MLTRAREADKQGVKGVNDESWLLRSGRQLSVPQRRFDTGGAEEDMFFSVPSVLSAPSVSRWRFDTLNHDLRFTIHGL